MMFVVSNNEHRDIVLATVANTIVEFCNQYGYHYIYAKGSTTARTRLYQMGLLLHSGKFIQAIVGGLISICLYGMMFWDYLQSH